MQEEKKCLLPVFVVGYGAVHTLKRKADQESTTER